MEKQIELLENGRINTYLLFLEKNNNLDYYKYLLREEYGVERTRSGETKAPNYFELKKELLKHDGVDVVLDMQMGNKHIYEEGLFKTGFAYYYKAKYIQYPILYHILFDDNASIPDLYDYLNNNPKLGVKYDEEMELLDMMGCLEPVEYDWHVPYIDKLAIIKEYLDSLSLKKINIRYADNLEEYQQVKRETRDIKKLIDLVNSNEKVKTNKKER